MKRPNYYLLLGLDPSQRNPAKIQEVIDQKQGEWSRDRNHPTKGREAQKNLELLPDIRAVLSDGNKRQAEACEAEKLLKEQREEANRQLDEMVAILASSGYLLEEQVQELVKRFKKRLREEEVRRRIKVPIREEPPRGKEPKPMLRRQLMKEIADRLRLIEKKDLYDFLDRPRNSSLAALQDRTRKLDTEIRNIDQKTAEVTARGELAGHCLSIFKTHEERARYDNALDHQRLSDLLDPVLKTAGAGGVLEANVVTNLLRKAQEAGIAVAEADAYVKEFAKKRGLSVQFTPEPEPPPPEPPDEGKPEPPGPEEKPRGLRPEVLRPAVGLAVCGVAIVCAVLFWPGGSPSEPVPSPAVVPGPSNPGGPDDEISDDERDLPPPVPGRQKPRRQPKPMTAEDWLARGRGHHAAGRLTDAIAAFDTAIQLDPNLAEAYYWRGVAHAETNRWEEAIADCTAALRLNPDYAEAYHQRGLAHKGKEDWDRAIADYEEAIRRKPALGPDPQFAEPYYRRALRRKEVQQWDEAIGDYEEAVRLDATIAPQPDRQFAEAYYMRGLSRKQRAVANRSLSDLNAAIADFTKAISLDPSYAKAYASRSLAYYDKGETTKADYDYQRAKQLGYGRENP